MMPVVRLNDATFGDLKTISAWLGTKTPTETIDQIVRQKMELLGMERDDESDVSANGTGSGAMEFESAPGLGFTKPTAASINGKAIHSPRWSSILLTMIEQVKAKGFDGGKLVAELNVPAKVGQYEEEGFKFCPNLGISVQGQSATDAWKEVDRLAKKWRIPVTVEFWWRQNPKAQYPGRSGMLRSGG